MAISEYISGLITGMLVTAVLESIRLIWFNKVEDKPKKARKKREVKEENVAEESAPTEKEDENQTLVSE